MQAGNTNVAHSHLTHHISLYSYIHLFTLIRQHGLRRWGRDNTAQSPGGGLVFTAVVDHSFFYSNMLTSNCVAASVSDEIAS